MTWILNNKRISLIIALFLCLMLTLGYANSLKGKLNKAEVVKAEAVAKAVKPFEDAQKRHQAELNKASQSYEALKIEQMRKRETIEREVQKIIERPIYYNNCFDADGLHKINDYIRTTPKS